MTSFCHLSYKRHKQEWWWQYCRILWGNSKHHLWNPWALALLINIWVSGRQAEKLNGLKGSFLYWCTKMSSNSWKTSTAQLIRNRNEVKNDYWTWNIKPGKKHVRKPSTKDYRDISCAILWSLFRHL